MTKSSIGDDVELQLSHSVLRPGHSRSKVSKCPSYVNVEDSNPCKSITDEGRVCDTVIHPPPSMMDTEGQVLRQRVGPKIAVCERPISDRKVLEALRESCGTSMVEVSTKLRSKAEEFTQVSLVNM